MGSRNTTSVCQLQYRFVGALAVKPSGLSFEQAMQTRASSHSNSTIRGLMYRPQKKRLRLGISRRQGSSCFARGVRCETYGVKSTIEDMACWVRSNRIPVISTTKHFSKGYNWHNLLLANRRYVSGPGLGNAGLAGNPDSIINGSGNKIALAARPEKRLRPQLLQYAHHGYIKQGNRRIW